MNGSGVTTLQLHIPGAWADGWLYRGQLVLWSRSNECYAVPLTAVRRAVRTSHGSTAAALADLLIFRSDWNLSEQMKVLNAIPGVGEAIGAALADYRELTVSVENAAASIYRHEPSGLALDTAIYANHVFVGTTEGLFESYFNPNYAPNGDAGVEQRVQSRVGSVSARYSAVNCSTREHGLLFAPMRFSNDARWWGEPPNFEDVAADSLRHSWVGRNILNYTLDEEPDLLVSHAVYERITDEARFEEYRVLGFDDSRDVRRIAVEALRDKGPVRVREANIHEAAGDETEFEVLGNANRRLLMRHGATLRVVELRDDIRRGPALRRNRDFETGANASKINADHVLSTHGVRSGFVVELDRELRLMTTHGSYRVGAVRAAKVRTFEYSRQYQDVILTVSDERVTLCGFLVH